MSETAVTVGPLDHGRRMSLEDFDKAEGQEGHLYELSRGVVVVSDVPDRRQLAQVIALRRQAHGYDAAQLGCIHTIASGSECKILLIALDSERHPDLAIYKTPPPDEDDDLWSSWIPEIVVEVVSPGSRDRDYVEKREEYLAFGVLEYWIVDAERGEVLVLRRVGGRWAERTLRPPDEYRTRLLPGFVLATAPIFQAANDA